MRSITAIHIKVRKNYNLFKPRYRWRRSPNQTILRFPHFVIVRIDELGLLQNRVKIGIVFLDFSFFFPNTDLYFVEAFYLGRS
jgi:hypothetical protein